MVAKPITARISMNYQQDFVNLDPALGNTDFRVMKCKACSHTAKPYANGHRHDVHGYKVYCEACHTWLGWGGKAKRIVADDGERLISSKWTAKRLQIETCQCCLRSIDRLGDNENLEIHHVVPVKDGGADTLDNIWVLCTTCHKEVHHRRVYFNGHMEKFFKAYLAVQRRNDMQGVVNE